LIDCTIGDAAGRFHIQGKSGDSATFCVADIAK
jgi:hypothetical protein